MIPSSIFLFIALFSGAGASISYAAYKHAKIASDDIMILKEVGDLRSCPHLPPPPDDYEPPAEKAKGHNLKKAVEEAVKPHLEQAAKLEKKLADAETLIKDLRVAACLAPDPKVAETKPGAKQE